MSTAQPQILSTLFYCTVLRHTQNLEDRTPRVLVCKNTFLRVRYVLVVRTFARDIQTKPNCGFANRRCETSWLMSPRIQHLFRHLTQAKHPPFAVKKHQIFYAKQFTREQKSTTLEKDRNCRSQNSRNVPPFCE